MTLDRFLVSFPKLANYNKPASVQVSFGFPLPAGYSAEKLASYELSGEKGPVEHSKFRPLAHWPDGSIKWVLVDASLSPKVATGTLRLRTNNGARQPESTKKDINLRTVTLVRQGVRITRSAENTTASGIDLRFEVTGPWGEFSLINDAAKLRSSARELYTHFQVDTSFSPTGLRYPVEVRLRGKAWRHGQVDLSCTICNTNPSNHPGGNWDLGENGAVLIENFSVVVMTTKSKDCEQLPMLRCRMASKPSGLPHEDSGRISPVLFALTDLVLISLCFQKKAAILTNFKEESRRLSSGQSMMAI